MSDSLAATESGQVRAELDAEEALAAAPLDAERDVVVPTSDTEAPEDVLLSAHRVTKRFGGLVAVKEADLVVRRGSIVSLIGPNGAGKTTLFNILAGITEPSGGYVVLRGERMIVRPIRVWLEPILWVLPTVLVGVLGLALGAVTTAAVVFESLTLLALGLLISMLLLAIVRPPRYTRFLVRLGIYRSARPNDMVVAGVGRTFQNIRLFQNMTALENVLVGMHSRLKSGLVAAFFSTSGKRSEEERARVRAGELLGLVGLEGRGDVTARNLPYGDQRRLEVARALGSDPVLLLLDEPTAGMNPNETAEMTALIDRLRRELSLTVLLIEHDMRVVMGISDRITVLDHGERIAEGTPEEVRRDPRVIEAYLGAPAG